MMVRGPRSPFRFLALLCAGNPDEGGNRVTRDPSSEEALSCQTLARVLASHVDHPPVNKFGPEVTRN